ncbi:hypothetical protein ACIGW8_17845 [Streptomyces sioyaensis]|uniref:hypothetical protein n=1 Tax=Streptomyces sioyaensis TaxID=67364 RepID=UPI0037D72BA3
MLTERRGECLPDWLDAEREDGLTSLRTLAAGIDRDREAVIAGPALPWNLGPVEGHGNRIKMLKRQMFGRAGFAPCESESCSQHDRAVCSKVEPHWPVEHRGDQCSQGESQGCAGDGSGVRRRRADRAANAATNWAAGLASTRARVAVRAGSDSRLDLRAMRIHVMRITDKRRLR